MTGRGIRTLAATGLVALLAASGCGTAGGTSGAAEGKQFAPYHRPKGTPITVRSGRPVAVTAGRVSLDPNTLSATRGTQVHLQIHNTTSGRHDFQLPSFHVHATLPPDKTTSVTFTVDRAGVLYFYSSRPGHAHGGMVGRLTVH